MQLTLLPEYGSIYGFDIKNGLKSDANKDQT